MPGFPRPDIDSARRRLPTAVFVALALGAAHGAAMARPTLGVDWELTGSDAPRVIGVRALDDATRSVTPSDPGDALAEHAPLLCATEKADDGAPLVTVTFGGGGVRRHLTIVTGLVPYDAEDRWNRIFTFSEAVLAALHATCAPAYDAAAGGDKICLARVSEVAAELATRLHSAAAVASGARCGGAAVDPSKLAFYVDYTDESTTAWDVKDLSGDEVATRVNLALKLRTLGTKNIDHLFPKPAQGTAAPARDAYETAFALVQSPAWDTVDPVVKGFWILYADALNAEVAFWRDAGAMPASSRYEDLHDLYPRAPLAAVYRGLKDAGVIKETDPLDLRQPRAINDALCVLSDGKAKACERLARALPASTSAWPDEVLAGTEPVDRGAGHEPTVAPRGAGAELTVILQARRRTAVVNQAAQLTYNPRKTPSLGFRSYSLVKAEVGAAGE